MWYIAFVPLPVEALVTIGCARSIHLSRASTIRVPLIAPVPALADYEKTLELDMDQFNADRQSKETEAFIEYDQEQALEQGLWYTPTVWVCGVAVDRDDLEEIVDNFLEGAL